MRNYILQNFPFLEDDFDALTDYQLFCKMVGYMKRVSLKVDDFEKKLNEYQNFFDNLDVQDEINNKLDEMYESGELASVIAEFLALQSTYTFDTVSDMLAATNLINGCYARTSGFYSYDDKGGAVYLIRNKDNDTIDNIHIFEIGDNLVAEIVPTNEIDVKQLGAKDDQDNKDIIQYALDNYKKVFINEIYEVYSSLSITEDDLIIDGKGGLLINHNKNDDLLVIDGVNNLTIKNISLSNEDKRIDNVAPDSKAIINCSDSNNINIDGINVYNVYNFGCEFASSHNINIINSIFKDCYYDMVTILEETTDVLVDNCIFDTVTTTYVNAYMFSTGAFNYSIPADYLCKNVTVQNSKFLNNPVWEGIDSHGCENLKVLNNYIYNCKTGISIQYDLRKTVNNIYSDNIEIKGNYITGTVDANLKEGITVWSSGDHFINNVIIEDNIIENYSNYSNTYGMMIGYIKNYNISGNIIRDFIYGGILLRETLLGIIDNNHIYRPRAYGGWGIYNLSNNWLITIKNNLIHGLNYLIARGVNCGNTGCLLLGENDIFNCDYRYTSSSSGSTPLGTITSETSNRLGCKGIHAIDQNDIIKSYCTDDVIKGDGSTLSNITITSEADTRYITLPSGENILNYCTIGEEITIPDAGTSGDDLTTTITDITSERNFILKDTIKTSVSNKHPSKSSSTWVSI